MAPSQRKEAEERARLMELVKLQGRELEAIKAEINILRYDMIRPASRLTPIIKGDRWESCCSHYPFDTTWRIYYHSMLFRRKGGHIYAPVASTPLEQGDSHR